MVCSGPDCLAQRYLKSFETVPVSNNMEMDDASFMLAR